MTEWNAEEYARVSGLQETMAEEVLALLDLADSEHILDVGCGDGRITAEIAIRVPDGRVVGIDPSQQMIAFAASHFSPADRPNLRFQVADCRDLRFDEGFDRVVSFNALHWIPEQDAALRSIHAALKPAGTAWLRLVPAGSRKSLEEILDDTCRSPRWAAYFRDFDAPYIHFEPDAYRAIAERCGFTVISQQITAKSWDFQSRPAFMAFGAVTFVEWTRRLPDDLRIGFIADVLDRYQAVSVDRPGQEHTFKFYQMDVVLEPR
jgi:trans-aconitate 2-methyltransferase